MLKKNIPILILFITLMYTPLTYNFNIKQLPYPYCTLVKVLPFNNHGWYANASWIEKLMKNNKITKIVEVGSWLGSSTRHMASLLPENGVLYAVDTWQGSIENQVLQADLLPTLYEQFLSNVIHAGLTDKIIPMKMTSQQAANELKLNEESFDLIYIDAAHDTQSVLDDLHSYFPFVANHQGILCGDDWWHEPVRIAVLQFAQEHALTVYADHNFWFVAQEGKFQLCSFVYALDAVWKFPKN
jgi:hypothetical protein